MPFQRPGDQSTVGRTPANHLSQAEACLRALLSCVGAPEVDRHHPVVAAALDELLSSDPAAVQAALRRVALTPLASLRSYRLTSREIDVAHLLSLGRSNSEIAAALSISEHTCRHHTERVLAKLGVRSRAAVGASLRALHDGARAAS